MIKRWWPKLQRLPRRRVGQFASPALTCQRTPEEDRAVFQRSFEILRERDLQPRTAVESRTDARRV